MQLHGPSAVLLLLLGSTSVLADSKTAPSADVTNRAPAAPAALLVKERIARDVDWYRQNLVKAYEAFGTRSEKWDAEATAALQAAAALWSHDPQPSGNEEERAWRASSKAIRAGCDDALVLYIHARMYRLAAQETTQEAARLSREAASVLGVTKYSAALKAMAHLRAAEAIIDEAISRGASRAKGALEEMEAAKGLLPSIATFRDVPQPLLLDLVGGILDAGRKLGADRSEDFESILPLFTKARAEKDAILPLLRARFLIDYAWDARSGRTVENVTETMQAVFVSRIGQAEGEIAKAMRLDPLSRAIAPMMLTIELAQGRGRERMESWFAYGVAVDPGSDEIYFAKLHYLEPRWHGSAEEMLSFGHEALQTKQWALRIPFVLVAAHFHLSHEYENPADYFGDNDAACRDIRNVYDPYLQLFPDAAYERSGYALMLYQCGDYAAAHKQFLTLGSEGRIGPFLTRANYENKRIDSAARATAKNH